MISLDKKPAILCTSSSFQKEIQGAFEPISTPLSFCSQSSNLLDFVEESNANLIVLASEYMKNEDVVQAKQIRSNPKFQHLPLLHLGKSQSNAEKARLLRAGFDQVHALPICPDILESVLIAMLRRASNFIPEADELNFDKITVNLKTQLVFLDGQPTHLTMTEFRILVELIVNKNNVISRERLTNKALSTKNIGPKTLDVHMTALRKKLGQDIGKRIKTVRGRGFMFTNDTL